MTKVLDKKAAANKRRVATKVVSETFANVQEGEKLAAAMVAAQSQKEKPYAVLIDTQGVAYLRVEETTKGAKYLISTGQAIEVIELDHGTISSRGLEIAPEASVLDAAKILAHPITTSVIISDRSQKFLEQILNDKELIAMPKTKSVKKVATKKEAKPRAERVSPTVTFKKQAKEGDLPKQAEGMLAIIKAAGKLTVAELQKKMEGKIETKQPMSSIWGFYRAKLIKSGFVTVG